MTYNTESLTLLDKVTEVARLLSLDPTDLLALPIPYDRLTDGEVTKCLASSLKPNVFTQCSSLQELGVKITETINSGQDIKFKSGRSSARVIDGVLINNDCRQLFVEVDPWVS